MMIGQKLFHSKKKTTSYLCSNHGRSVSLAGGLLSSVCAYDGKNKSEQHSRAFPRAKFIYNGRNICRHSCGRPEVMHCLTYCRSGHVLRQWAKRYREKKNRLEAAGQTGERATARRACQSKALCGHKVYRAGSHRVSARAGSHLVNACHLPVGL